MKSQIALITILTDNVPAQSRFYQDALGFSVKTDMGEYVEFESEGVRFAVCARSTMKNATGDPSFAEARVGQSFELAFPLVLPAEVDEVYAEILARGARPIQPPANMPWGQRTAFFADPDGNIHELFADLPAAA
jgi:lactoylglutathione lyase